MFGTEYLLILATEDAKETAVTDTRWNVLTECLLAQFKVTNEEYIAHIDKLRGNKVKKKKETFPQDPQLFVDNMKKDLEEICKGGEDNGFI